MTAGGGGGWMWLRFVRRRRGLQVVVVGACLLAISLLAWLAYHVFRPPVIPNFDGIKPFDTVLLDTFGEREIPRTIHQIWLGKNQPPCQWISTWMYDYVQANPGWSYKLWRTEDIEHLGLENRDIFELEPHPANKADIARYEILYRFGGIFIDADSMWINAKPLDGLLHAAGNTGLFFGEEVRPGKMTPPSTVTPILAVGVIGCARQHPAMAHAIHALGHVYRDLRFRQGAARWEATGPDFMTAALRGVPKTVFPNFYFFPGGWWGTNPAMTREEAERINPDSYMYQFGYSTGRPLDADVRGAVAKRRRSEAIRQCLLQTGSNPE